jgi:GcrA cell cycle regulator
MDWNDETITRLRALWAEGHSTAEIGRRLGVSKNAVVGKAHRLNLPPRPSPIRRDATPGARPRSSQPRRVTGPTLPSLAASPAAAQTMATVEAPMRHVMREVLDLEEPAVAPHDMGSARLEDRVDVAPSAPRPTVVRPVTSRPIRFVACCWPLGEPGTKSFRFCDAEAAQGKPYCQTHVQLAYVKVRDRREDAA